MLANAGFDIGDVCLILAQNDAGHWWIKGASQKGFDTCRNSVHLAELEISDSCRARNARNNENAGRGLEA